MNTFRLIIDDIALPSHIDPAVAESFYRRAVEAVSEQLRGLDATPGYFRWMKTVEVLGEDIAATFDKSAQEAVCTPAPPPMHVGKDSNAQNPRCNAASGGSEPGERL